MSPNLCSWNKNMKLFTSVACTDADRLTWAIQIKKKQQFKPSAYIATDNARCKSNHKCKFHMVLNICVHAEGTKCSVIFNVIFRRIIWSVDTRHITCGWVAQCTQQYLYTPALHMALSLIIGLLWWNCYEWYGYSKHQNHPTLTLPEIRSNQSSLIWNTLLERLQFVGTQQRELQEYQHINAYYVHSVHKNETKNTSKYKYTNHIIQLFLSPWC